MDASAASGGKRRPLPRPLSLLQKGEFIFGVPEAAHASVVGRVLAPGGNEVVAHQGHGLVVAVLVSEVFAVGFELLLKLEQGPGALDVAARILVRGGQRVHPLKNMRDERKRVKIQEGGERDKLI